MFSSMSSKVSVASFFKNYKKNPLEETLLLLSPIVSNLVTCEFLLVVDYHRGSRIEMVYYPPYPWGVCPQMSQIPCVDSHNSVDCFLHLLDIFREYFRNQQKSRLGIVIYMPCPRGVYHLKYPPPIMGLPSWEVDLRGQTPRGSPMCGLSIEWFDNVKTDALAIMIQPEACSALIPEHNWNIARIANAVQCHN